MLRRPANILRDVGIGLYGNEHGLEDHRRSAGPDLSERRERRSLSRIAIDFAKIGATSTPARNEILLKLPL